MSQNDEQILGAIEAKISLHQDWPKKGVLYRHLSPVLRDVRLSKALYEQLYNRVRELDINHVLGIESRGFALALALHERLGLPLSYIRKKNKLPGEVFSINYELEYGSDTLEIEKNALPEGSKCLIVDDLLATGGTMSAAKKLIEMTGSQVVACIVVIDLVQLHKPDIFGQTKLISLFRY